MVEYHGAALDLRITQTISKSPHITLSHGTIFNASREVIIKEITFDTINEANRAVHEATFQQKLEHPNVCKLYDCFLEENKEEMKVVLVIERLETDLMTEIQRRKREENPWNEAELVAALSDFTAALEYAEASRIAHHDLKPSNLYYHHNHYKVGDFGSAAAFFTATSSNPSPAFITYSQVGIPANLPYASPEYRQIAIETVSRGSTVTSIDYFLSDVYSLGLILIEMAELEFPHELKNITQLQAQIPLCLQKIRPNYPLLTQLLEKMMDLEPQQRPRFSVLYTLIQTYREIPTAICAVCGKIMAETAEMRRANRGFVCSQQCLALFNENSIICAGCKEKVTYKSMEIAHFPCNFKHVFHDLDCLFRHIAKLTTNFSDLAVPYTCPICGNRVIKEEIESLFERSRFKALQLAAYNNSCHVCHNDEGLWRCRKGHLVCKNHHYAVFWVKKCAICTDRVV